MMPPLRELFVIVTADESCNRVRDALLAVFAARDQLLNIASLEVHVVLVCDACTPLQADMAETLLESGQDYLIECRAHDQARARILGLCLARSMSDCVSHVPLHRVWYAGAHADTCIAADWLCRHWLAYQSGAMEFTPDENASIHTIGQRADHCWRTSGVKGSAWKRLLPLAGVMDLQMENPLEDPTLEDIQLSSRDHDIGIGARPFSSPFWR